MRAIVLHLDQRCDLLPSFQPGGGGSGSSRVMFSWIVVVALNFLLFVVDMSLFFMSKSLRHSFMSICVAIFHGHAVNAKMVPLNLFAVLH